MGEGFIQEELLFGESADDGDNAPLPGILPARGYDIERKIAETWGLPLKETVVVTLRSSGARLEGRLELAELPSALNAKHPLHLKISGQRIDSKDIESWKLAGPGA